MSIQPRSLAPAGVRTIAAPPSAPRPPRLRVSVARLGANGARPDRHLLDTETLPPEDGRRLHALVDAVESAGPPAGASFGLVVRPAGATPSYEVTVARGFGHWTVTVSAGIHGTSLAALIDHVRGVPDRR